MSDESIWPENDVTGELLRQAAAGDAQASNDLLERHREALRKLVRFRLDRRLSARVDASDVVQDVLLEASQRLSAYLAAPNMPFHLWLRHLARDRMIDLHRRHHAHRRSVDREQSLNQQFGDQSSVDLAQQLADSELTPAAASIRREFEERFLEALDQLDDADREILVMRHVEHLGNSEVATVLQLSPEAASMRHLRALRKLRAVLTNRGGNELA